MGVEQSAHRNRSQRPGQAGQSRRAYGPGKSGGIGRLRLFRRQISRDQIPGKPRSAGPGYSARAPGDPMKSDDLNLVKEARAGDKQAFRRLVETHQDRLFGLVISMVSNREQAEDLLQEIFVKAYFALESFEGQSSFYTWLYRIASNHCLDYLRKNRPPQIS